MLYDTIDTPDSKVHGANMVPTWVLSAPDGPHIGPMKPAIKVYLTHLTHSGKCTENGREFILLIESCMFEIFGYHVRVDLNIHLCQHDIEMYM